METKIIGLLAETMIHPGVGRSMGTVDLPVAREKSTDIPVIYGSSVKGALRDKVDLLQDEGSTTKTANRMFGSLLDGAGKLLICDARLVLLPVRSLSGGYRWLTCPLLLERFSRDVQRAGLDKPFSIVPVEKDCALGPDAPNSCVFLEERQVTVVGAVPNTVLAALKNLLKHQETQGRLASQLMVVSDHDFAWFARYALQVNARNVLNEKTKASTNLWYEETLPPDTVFSWMVSARTREDTNTLADLMVILNTQPYFQIGGNETVGQGWFAVNEYTTPQSKTE